MVIRTLLRTLTSEQPSEITGPKLGTPRSTPSAQPEASRASSKVKLSRRQKAPGAAEALPGCGQPRLAAQGDFTQPHSSPSFSLPAPAGSSWLLPYRNRAWSLLASQEPPHATGRSALVEQTDVSNPGWEGGRGRLGREKKKKTLQSSVKLRASEG